MYVQVLYHINTFDDKVDLYLKEKTIFAPRVSLFLGFKAKLNWNDCSPNENCNVSC